MSFATAINCMDGRTQIPINEFVRAETGAEYVDTVTEPGPVRILAEEPLSPLAESILARVKISVEKHESQCITMVAHHDCAGNPQPRDVQMQQLDQAVRFLASHYPYTQILGVWVGPSWQTEKIFHLNP